MKKRHFKKMFKKIMYFANPSWAKLFGRKKPAQIPATQMRVAAPLLALEKDIHKRAFRNACIEVLGEDPDEDWV